MPAVVTKLEERLLAFKNDLSERSRTARLWIQYMYFVNVAKNYLRAERTNDWNLHLVSLSQMINLFAASGHKGIMQNLAACTCK